MEMVVDHPNSTDDMQRNLKHNEIAAYLNCRYISAPEAIWRLSEYKMHQQTHTVIRLAVHLPEQQRVYTIEKVKKQQQLKEHPLKILTLLHGLS